MAFRDDASHVPAGESTFGRQSWHKDDAATPPGGEQGKVCDPGPVRLQDNGHPARLLPVQHGPGGAALRALLQGVKPQPRLRGRVVLVPALAAEGGLPGGDVGDRRRGYPPKTTGNTPYAMAADNAAWRALPAQCQRKDRGAAADRA